MTTKTTIRGFFYPYCIKYYDENGNILATVNTPWMDRLIVGALATDPTTSYINKES